MLNEKEFIMAWKNRETRLAHSRAYYLANKEKIKLATGYYKRCSLCNEIKTKTKFFVDDLSRRCTNICFDCYNKQEIDLLYLQRKIYNGCYHE